MTLLLLKSGHCSEKVPVIRAPQKKSTARRRYSKAVCWLWLGASAKSLLFKPLKAKQLKKGAPGGTETFIRKCGLNWLSMWLQMKFVACSEAGLGLTAAWADLEISAATARHHSHEFAPMKRFRKNGLSKGPESRCKSSVYEEACSGVVACKAVGQSPCRRQCWRICDFELNSADAKVKPSWQKCPEYSTYGCSYVSTTPAEAGTCYSSLLFGCIPPRSSRPLGLCTARFRCACQI